ncbi:MAG TPA: GntR family transcriptional regulator [Planctomycetota bacterium]|nr:GntR family transcriptional regulator [Planctomycetota bacterium]
MQYAECNRGLDVLLLFCQAPMELRPRTRRLARTFLVEGAYEAILENILSGALPSGTTVSEVALARDLNVSRTPVHQALARLAKEGLIEHRSGLQPRIARFNREDVIEIYDMRLLLETAATQRAAKRMDPRVLADLTREAAELAASPDGAEWTRQALDFDARFHDAVAAASGNRRLRQEIAKYRLLVRAFCRLTGNSENLRDALREHQAVLRALAERQPQAAGQAMAQHVQKRVDAVLGTLYREAK